MRIISSVAYLSVAMTFCGKFSQAQQQGAPRLGPEHAALQKMEGTWDAVVTVLGGVKAKGEMTYKMECGGLWRERDLKFTLGQLSLHTKGLDTYDAAKKKYVSVQIDSTTTTPSVLEGTYDDSMTTLTQTGEARDFKGAPEQIKQITKHVDDEHLTVEIFRVFQDGKERKMVTAEYTKRKDTKKP